MKKQNTGDDVVRTLGIGVSRQSWGRRSVWLIVAVIAVLGIVAGLLWQSSGNKPRAAYETQPVRLGNLVVTVSATGHLEPTNQVEVGSELSGIIDTVLLDFNERVRAGQVLAQLDTDTLNAEVLQSEAALAATQAQVGQVREDQTATFTVDAFPDRTFDARIVLVRFGAQEVDGVITYETL